MKRITWLILILVIVSVMLIVVNTGTTTSYFTDDEPSTDDALGIKWGLITLSDGFEGTPWDQYWDENGTTDWQPGAGYGGSTYSAEHASGDTYLTSDEIDASAATQIAVSFWFNLKSLTKGPLYVQIYNGSTYDTTWYDLVTHPGVTTNTWFQFTQNITDDQYFIAGFNIRFDGSTMATDAFIDDVLIVTDSIPPSAPTTLTAVAGDTEVSLDWDDNGDSDLAGYNVHRSTNLGGPYTEIASLVASSDYLDQGLTNDVTYYYVVTAEDTGTNESGYSEEVNATPTDLPPDAPTNLVATAGDWQVSLNWDDNGESDLAGYNVHRSETTGSPYTEIASLVASSDYNDTTVTAGTTYYYVVTAEDLTSNESANSNEASATPYDDPPIPPTTLIATAGDWQVSLDWDDNGESDLAGYNVHRSTNLGGPYTGIASLVATSDYSDTTVTAGTLYYYVVTAEDDGTNESTNSNEASATPYDDPPAAPTTLIATAGDWQVSLNWDDNGESDLAGYNVHRSTNLGGPYTGIASLVATSDYNDTTVTAGTLYYYVVTAEDDGTNESTNSNEASATPYDDPPAAPTTLIATAGDWQVNLNWDDNGESDLAGYNVHRSTNLGGPYTEIASLVATSDYSDITVTAGTLYYYVVTAEDTGTNESTNSNEASATPYDDPPAAPTTLIATAGDGVVDLDWDDNGESDLAGYNVHRSTNLGGPYTEIASLVATSDYNDTTVTAGTTYYYVVTAEDNGTNESSNSNEASATPYDNPPAAPTTLIATTPVERQVNLDWDDNIEGDLAGYNVHRSTNLGGPYTEIASLVATSDYNDTTVTAGTLYYYVVTAEDLTANESTNSNEVSATPYDDPPAAPTTLIATSGGKQIGLDWDDNGESDLAGYNVHRSTNLGGPYTEIASLVPASSYNDGGLTAGTTYYYVVTAEDNGANESTNSNEASAIPTPITLLSDDFELTPWDQWDGNGTTDWQPGAGYGGSTYSAEHASGDTYLTSDDLDASDAASITVSFWFNIKDLSKGPLYVQIYNGSTYNNLYDLTTYPGVIKNTWHQFSQTIAESQYFISNFRLRFDGSTQATNSFVDDVLIEKN